MFLISIVTGSWVEMCSAASSQGSHWSWTGLAVNRKVSCPPVHTEEGKVETGNGVSLAFLWHFSGFWKVTVLQGVIFRLSYDKMGSLCNSALESLGHRNCSGAQLGEDNFQKKSRTSIPLPAKADCESHFLFPLNFGLYRVKSLLDSVAE